MFSVLTSASKVSEFSSTLVSIHVIRRYDLKVLEPMRKGEFVLLGLLLLCFLGAFYSPEFRDGTDSALEGPTGLTC